MSYFCSLQGDPGVHGDAGGNGKDGSPVSIILAGLTAVLIDTFSDHFLYLSLCHAGFSRRAWCSRFSW